MSATVYYRLSADASLGYRRNGRSQSSPPAFSSNEIPFPISAGCYSAKLNLDAIALDCSQTRLTVLSDSRTIYAIFPAIGSASPKLMSRVYFFAWRGASS